MNLKELLEKADAEKKLQEQEEERLETLIKKGDEFEKKISEMEKRLKKSGHSGIKKAAKLAAGISLATLIFFSGGYLARKQVMNDLSAVHNDIGILYKLRGEPNKAAYQYQRSIELNDKNIYVYHNLGALYLDVSDDYQKAEQYLKKAIELRPDYAPSYVALGDAYLRQKRYDEAEVQYNEAIKIDGNNANARRNLGELYKLVGKTEQAETQFRIAEELVISKKK